ncbi:MAG: DUF362 domain-containing protein [Planctomycetota bacterium]
MSNRAIVCNASYANKDRLQGVISDILNAFALDVQGRSVLVKPNILGPFEAERGITTHPAVVHAIVAEVTRQGGRVMVGDNPGIYSKGSNIRCAMTCGIYEVCAEVFTNLGERPTEVETRSKYAKRFLVSEPILEADLVISLAKFKTHLLTGITGAVKNTYGYLVGAQKSRLHSAARTNEEFSEAVVDVYQVRPPDFALIDGVVGMEGMGPSGGRLRDVGKIIGSDNCVVADAAMTLMMGADSQGIAHLNAAKRRGLGENDPKKIEIEGDFEVVPHYRMPSPIFRSWLLTAISRAYTRIVVKQPRLRKERCRRCGLCATACPAEAISLAPYPVFDRTKCFSCFCCHEYCKEKAIDVVKTIRLSRWFRRE